VIHGTVESIIYPRYRCVIDETESLVLDKIANFLSPQFLTSLLLIVPFAGSIGLYELLQSQSEYCPFSYNEFLIRSD